MEAYSAAVRISSTVFATIAVAAHSLVIILSHNKSKHDHSAYIFLMQVYSTVVLLYVIPAWFVMNRIQSLPNEHSIIFAYGLGGLIDRLITGIIQVFGLHMFAYCILLVPTCMATRTFILFNQNVTKLRLIMVIGLLYSVCFAIFVYILIPILEMRPIILPAEYTTEAMTAVPIVELYTFWEAQTFYAGNNFTYFAVLITFALRFVMVRKLKQITSSFSNKTRQLHHSFISLLTLEASVLFLGIIVSLFRLFAKLNYEMWPELSVLLGAFSLPILLSMPMIQGTATLMLVPYLRQTFRRRAKTASTVSF